jgi:hypothetical protein
VTVSDVVPVNDLLTLPFPQARGALLPTFRRPETEMRDGDRTGSIRIR